MTNNPPDIVLTNTFRTFDSAAFTFSADCPLVGPSSSAILTCEENRRGVHQFEKKKKKIHDDKSTTNTTQNELPTDRSDSVTGGVLGVLLVLDRVARFMVWQQKKSTLLARHFRHLDLRRK
jgi:hypothetical protein